MNIGVEKKASKLTLTIPHERLDLTIPEDIVEEVGRIYDYDKIKESVPKKKKGGVINTHFYYVEKIKDALILQGFSEVYLYTFRDKGIVEVEKPLASDKKVLRENLSNGMKECLEFNILNEYKYTSENPCKIKASF